MVQVAASARDNPWIGRGVLVAALLLAGVTARPYAGAWNDGSRLATVECLVDYHTWAIDNSVFVKVPFFETTPSPYRLDDLELRVLGTGDKLYIKGHFYSDKSPVPALFLAGVYQGWQWTTGLTARRRADLFCYVLTLASSGFAYVVTVGCLYHLGGVLGLSLRARLVLTASLALATVALTYAEFVNNHILLLGVSFALMLGLVRLSQIIRGGQGALTLLAGLGTLAGLAYSIDLGAGPVLLLGTAALVGWRCRRPAPLILFGLAALPWLVLHHAVNYHIGGTWGPANAVAEYFQWPGCSFNGQNLTGGWKHRSIGRFLLYAADLLLGKRGFLGHNLPLFLALLGLVPLLRRRLVFLPEILYALGCSGGIWLLYAANSNNTSGACLSIRWLVPLLAPGFFLLAVLLREYPRYLPDLAILSFWGTMLTALGWGYGPWIKHMVPYFWPVQAAALTTWGLYRLWQWQRHRPSLAAQNEPLLPNAA